MFMNKFTEDFHAGDRVIYVPNHAKGDTNHDDCEYGVVSSSNSRYVFVIFNDEINRASKACEPRNLVKFESKHEHNK